MTNASGKGIFGTYHPRAVPNTTVASAHYSIVTETAIPGADLHARGKVRDVYRADGQLLIAATDRISAFDYILPTGIPRKGRVLTQLSIFWFDFLRDVVPTHFITADITRFPPEFREHADQLEGRSMLVKRADMIEIDLHAA